MNFKRMEVSGTTKEEALANAPFGIQGDATQAYRNARKNHTGTWTDANMKQFMLDYLTKKSKNLPGVGFSITVESAVADTRQRPYTIEDVKREGTSDYVQVYQLVDDETGAVVAETTPKRVEKTNEAGETKLVWTNNTKADAKELGRELYEDGYKGNLTCIRTKQVIGGQPVAFKMKYTPSKSARNGVYIVFGIENA